MPPWLNEFLPIALLLAAVVIVLCRLPRADLGHSPAFLARRRLNWLPLGLTYSFLYMGRYNLTVAKNALGASVTNQDFGEIFAIGTWVYGIAFVINGPLTDRLGGRATIMISAAGACLCNLAMGIAVTAVPGSELVGWLKLLYAANMYFQSFGAVSIVKVNAHWFHVRERGTFSGIFGILISLGLYFAYDWSRLIIDFAGVPWAFYAPAAILLVFLVLDWRLVFDQPSAVGHPDLDAGDASLTADGERLSAWQVARRLFAQPILVTIVLIEFCSGYFRQAVMQWSSIYAKQTGLRETEFIHQHWGMMLCVAGILGGVLAGTISDHVFQSRRGPSTVLLYGAMLLLSLLACTLLGQPALGAVMVAMSLCIIGVHGLLSGTASMDFAGKRNTGLAVGIIDGFVYLGSGAQALVLGALVPDEKALGPDGLKLAADPANWKWWPVAIVPAALVGLVLSLRLWNARPRGPGAGH